MTYLAVPIAAKSFDEAVGQIKAAAAGGAEILELRTDYIEQLSASMVNKLIAETRNIGSKLLLTVTCRNRREGGAVDYPDP